MPETDRLLYPRLYAALREPDPAAKCAAVRALRRDWLAGRLERDDTAGAPALSAPGRPARPELVDPRRVPRRGIASREGHGALIHAIAHIEFNAINLALDAAWRFAGLPDDYVGDWLRVADEEARHFGLLADRLAALGYAYGDFTAHNGLWDMADKTRHDVLLRMALVPRILEARGLDVTPGIQKRLAEAGDAETVALLDVIYRDEIGHVEIGNYWFTWLCDARGLEPLATFRALLAEHDVSALSGPFNWPARRAAGFTEFEQKMLEDFAARRRRPGASA
ncbi:uncharacterized ferritin-like protein (DUF455 family) [Crenobacter luteus]|uniref:Rhamnosyltransferase n=1 Tax=Crenobacter luteus TaxID=1452487 RepID=A0A163D4N7_9NEIS|nr:ferritin-like domain-containing protein [Crenobacter luteus]KZE33847.1 hypothetical protein AVW16_07210 [Crenobacter luteus]TCP13853.1 uncharacterized ferritin-like protein (DUF455 family) [Crenobacter luteus]